MYVYLCFRSTLNCLLKIIKEFFFAALPLAMEQLQMGQDFYEITIRICLSYSFSVFDISSYCTKLSVIKVPLITFFKLCYYLYIEGFSSHVELSPSFTNCASSNLCKRLSPYSGQRQCALPRKNG